MKQGEYEAGLMNMQVDSEGRVTQASLDRIVLSGMSEGLNMVEMAYEIYRRAERLGANVHQVTMLNAAKLVDCSYW